MIRYHQRIGTKLGDDRFALVQADDPRSEFITGLMAKTQHRFPAYLARLDWQSNVKDAWGIVDTKITEDTIMYLVVSNRIGVCEKHAGID
jgi:hypothetical protein